MKLTRAKIIILVVVALVVLLFQFGVKINLGDGELRIGKQDDLTVSQRADLQNSPFYHDYFSSGNLVVMNVWATWCGPCIAEMPALNEVKRHYAGEPIDFISFSIDKDSVKLAGFIASSKFEFTDITFDNLAYCNAILNVLRGKKSDDRISSISVPMTFIFRDTEVLEFVKGTVEREELVELIDRHRL